MLNSVRFMISVQLILRFAMKTSNFKANNSNDANDNIHHLIDTNLHIYLHSVNIQT